MSKFQKQLFSAFASGALLLNAVVPVSAASTLTITGNGASSTNTVELSQTQSTLVTQTNTATVSNNVTSKADSGGNTSSYNTGGNVSIGTGAATTAVGITNTLNANTAQVACCNNQGIDVSIKNNGADSTNSVGVTSGDNVRGLLPLEQTANTTVVQNNTADVSNSVSADAISGKNRADYNTNGNVTIGTGPASSTVIIDTMANGNMAKIGTGTQGTGNGLSAVISGNGFGSENSLELALNHSTALYQDNTADVSNNVNSLAKSGYNTASDNTGGSVDVHTGKAESGTQIDNMLNFNWADVACCATFNAVAKIMNNGALSDNSIELLLSNERLLEQSNTADVSNNVDTNAISGKNHADYNTGGPVDVMTGPAAATTLIDNMLNFNQANLDCCTFGVNASLNGNGFGSDNAILAALYNDRADYQTNGAELANSLGGKGAVSGYNTGSYDTFGDPNADPSIHTGPSTALTSISNAVNLNKDGTTLGLPGLNFQLQFDWNWSHVLSMFGF